MRYGHLKVHVYGKYVHSLGGLATEKVLQFPDLHVCIRPKDLISQVLSQTLKSIPFNVEHIRPIGKQFLQYVDQF